MAASSVPSTAGNSTPLASAYHNTCYFCFHFVSSLVDLSSLSFSNRYCRCTTIPYSDGVPEFAKTRSWPCMERNGLICIWHDVEQRFTTELFGTLYTRNSPNFFPCYQRASVVATFLRWNRRWSFRVPWLEHSPRQSSRSGNPRERSWHGTFELLARSFHLPETRSRQTLPSLVGCHLEDCSRQGTVNEAIMAVYRRVTYGTNSGLYVRNHIESKVDNVQRPIRRSRNRGQCGYLSSGTRSGVLALPDSIWYRVHHRVSYSSCSIASTLRPHGVCWEKSKFSLSTILETILLSKWKQRLIQNKQPNQQVPRAFAKFVLKSLLIQFERDIPIWNNKVFLPNPLVVKQDGAIPQFRRWYSKFYSKNHEKLLQQLQNPGSKGFSIKTYATFDNIALNIASSLLGTTSLCNKTGEGDELSW